MGMSNGRDQLSRVAFETSSGDFYKFAINPQSISEQITARNVFLQTESSIQMQGYGQGLHTIEISGTTGVNRGRGFDNLIALKNLIVNHLNSAHDSKDGGATGNVSLIFHNFTDNESWRVELNQQGIKIDQSKDDPLSFFYTISMVVVGAASTPATSEITWIQLGNINPSLPGRRIPTGMEYQYGKTAVSGSFDFAGYQRAADQFERSAHETIRNYGQSGMYEPQPFLSKSQIIALYKVVYGSLLPNFDWAKYVEAAGLFSKSKEGSVNNYGQSNAGDAVKILPPYSIQKIYQELYGDTVPNIDYNSYQNIAKLFTQMRLGTVMNYNEDGAFDTDDSSLTVGDAVAMYSIIYQKTVPNIDYSHYEDAAFAFTASKEGSILNYDQYDLANELLRSWNNPLGASRLVEDDGTNPWEAYSNSYQNISDEGVQRYINPLVSRDAAAYTYSTINTILRV